MLTSGGPLTILVAGAAALVMLVVAARLVFAPAVMAGLLVVVVVSDISSVVGKSGTLSVYLLTLALATVTLVVAVRRGALRMRWSPFFLLAAIWLATRAVSVLFARSVSLGTSELTDEAKGLVLLVILTLLLTGVRRLEVIIGLSVVTLSVLAGVTIVQEFVLHDSSNLGGLSGIGVASEIAGLGARHSGTEIDPNFWGRMLVLFLPLALVLAWKSPDHVRAARSWWRNPLWWFLAVGALLVGVYLSQSRGDLIAALVTAAVTLALIVRNRVRLVAGAAAVTLLVLVLPGTSHRLGTLASLDKPPATGVVDQSLLGREAALKAGLAMFRDSPLVGVGAGNFESAGRTYQRELGLAALSLRNGSLLAPHDLYLQMVAEGGAIGLLGWLIFYLGSLVLMWRTRRRSRQLHGVDSMQGRLATGVLASLIGWGVASIFLHLADLPVLLVIVAFGAALHLRTRDELAAAEEKALAQQGEWPPSLATLEPARPKTPARQPALIALALLLFAGSAFMARLASTTRVGWSTTVVAGMVPEATGTGYSVGYSYAVLSRTRTLPTYVELASSRRFLTAAADSLHLSSVDRRDLYLSTDRAPNADTFRITVTTANEQLATPLLASTVGSFGDYLSSAGSLYHVQVLANAPVTRVGSSRAVERLMAIVAGALGLLTVLVGASRYRRRRSASLRRRLS